MPTLDDVYRKFGEASEAAQLLESELGNILFLRGAVTAGLIDEPDPDRASDILRIVDRQTLGQLLKSLNLKGEAVAQLEELLSRALEQRNHLSHGFYRHHNFRRNSDEGRVVMMRDLEVIHAAILDAYKAVMLVFAGIDLEKITDIPLPTTHLPL